MNENVFFARNNEIIGILLESRKYEKIFNLTFSFKPLT